MTRFFCGLIILATGAGCGSSGVDIPDVPPMSIGGGGVAVMSDAKTPRQAYELAYARLRGYHHKIGEFLKPGMSGNTSDLGARKTLKQIVESLQIMHALTVDPWKKDLVEHIDWYQGWSTASTLSGGFLNDLARRERIIKNKFSPGVVDVLLDWPPGMKPEDDGTAAKPPPPVEPDTVPPVPDDKPKPPPADTPKPPATGDVPLWMLYNAWKQAHQDLVETYTKNADCAKAYKRVREALAAMKPRLAEDRQKKLLLCDSIYEQQHDETKGFKTLPEGAKQEDILRPLEMVAKTMTEYDPDKK